MRSTAVRTTPQLPSCVSVTVARHILRLQLRIEGIAETASVRGKAGVNLDDRLAALDLTGRRRVTMLLELIKAFSNDPDEQAAADHIRMRAARAWYGPSVSFSRGLVEGSRTDRR
ncbi:hypothetical protein [Microvirga massiliensis]|uniref:hypothetical protein n=1 Tax=Microvirga massiliensis TaxID=1033741 RepID=UPI0012E19DA5|nr:hypothetical protein [Microvirga massiliensis]